MICETTSVRCLTTDGYKDNYTDCLGYQLLPTYTCTDPPVATQSVIVASMSGIIRPDVDTLVAMQGFVWIVFIGLGLLVFAAAINQGTWFFNK